MSDVPLECPVCDGAGNVAVDPPDWTLPGARAVMVECEVCYGAGRVTDEQLEALGYG